MSTALLLLKQSGIMLIYLLIGYFLYRKKLVSKQGSADMGRMLLYIIMPMAIVKSYMRDFSTEMLKALLVSFVLALLALLLSVLVSRLLFQKEEREETLSAPLRSALNDRPLDDQRPSFGRRISCPKDEDATRRGQDATSSETLRVDVAVERFGAAFSNAGFIGIPLVQMALGSEAVFYVASFVAILNILQWTYGVYIMTEDRSVIRLQKIATNPIVISFLAGLILFFVPFSLPQMLQDTISTLSNMNGPIAMIVLGTYLAQIPLKELFTEKLVYKCTVVRLILIPALTLILLLIFPVGDRMIKLAVMIAAAAPVGTNVAIFAQLYGQEYTRAVKEVCLSTLFCIVTLPIITGIADMVL